MDRGVWRATIHGVSKSRTRLKQLGTQEPMPEARKGQRRGKKVPLKPSEELALLTT